MRRRYVDCCDHNVQGLETEADYMQATNQPKFLETVQKVQEQCSTGCPGITAALVCWVFFEVQMTSENILQFFHAG